VQIGNVMNRSSDIAKPAGRIGRSATLIAFARSRRFVLPLMTAACGTYVVVHSPVRDVIAASLGLKSRTCYFICTDALRFNDAADSLSAWTLIATAALAAWIVSDWFDGASYERPLVFGISALAFIAVPAAIVGGIGSWSGTTLLHPPLGPLLSMVPAGLVLIVGLQKGWRPHRPRLLPRQNSRLVLLVAVLATGLLLASTVLSLIHPPDGGDAISYHAPLAVFLWREGNLSSFLERAPVLWALAHPGTAELWYGLLGIAGGESLADLGQLPFALLGGLAVGAFARRLGLGRGAAYLGGVAFLLAPMVVMQSTTQANDILGTALLMSTMALACSPAANWTGRRLALLGLGLGMVATTKLALLPCVAAVIVFTMGVTLYHARQRNHWAGVMALTLVLSTFFLAAAPWWLRNVVRYGNPVYPAGLPFIGRGVFVNEFGPIDTEFVPAPVAWPIYPLVESHDDRSGFGMIFAIGMIPGFALVVLRRRWQPLWLYATVAVFTLPAWWKFTLHEPRFLLVFSGLGCAFVPWALLALPRRQRHFGGALLAAGAVFSALVTFDQALLPLARQPVARLEFYDRVWGVDPIVAALPENESLLHHTGYGPPRSDYAAYYALLGGSRGRVVVPVDLEATSESIVETMRKAGVRYAYVTALPSNRPLVETLYDASRFQLVNISVIERGERWGARRHLYQPASKLSESNGIRRYLYRLK
jgi:hypothetical protein